MQKVLRGVFPSGFILFLTGFCFLAGLSHTTGRLEAQTTQGLISGSVVNSVSGRPISAAAITYSSAALSASGTYPSDEAGYYFLPLLSTGTYTIRISADGYQSQELQELELPVAGRIQIDFKLRPLNDVWEAGQFRSVFLPGSKTIVTFYGPDVDTSRSGTFEGQSGKRGTLDTSSSYVIDPVQIGDLPLLGRDVYTMLVSLPGVTANNGTARGLGISVAGQRPSSSNYLLDGVENDNYLVTGPLNQVAPEAVQEYRISTNNYSAEYGRTSGFIANAVTRAGGPGYHGIAYGYLKNEALNAADFADNLTGYGRRADKEYQFGYQAGGPVIPGRKISERLFFSSAFEQLISHSLQNPQTYILPTTNFISAFNLQPTSLARQLLEKYPGPVIQSNSVTAPYSVAQPVIVDRSVAFERGDYATKSGRDHFMGRVAISRVTEPNFIWSPYKDFISSLQQHTTGVAGNWMHTWTPRLTSELKASFSDDNLWWDRAHPEVPTLAASDGTYLPGSTAFYAYRNHNKSTELIYSTVWTRNKHVISAGVGLLFRSNSGYLTAGRDGEYIFSGAFNWALGRPQYFRASVDRFKAIPSLTNYDRDYRYAQNYFFLQDSFRVSSRLTLNYGVRYERFGAPQNTGSVKDALLILGAGKNFNERLANATLTVPSAGGNQQIFGADNADLAPRFGFSFDPFGKSKSILRGSYGMFFDRPFDNIWQNTRSNGFTVPFYTVPNSATVGGIVNYLAPVSSVLPSYAKQSSDSNFPGITAMDPSLKNGYSQNFFLGVQQSIGDNLTLEITGTGTLGRRLITNDYVNRQYTTQDGDGRPNESLPDVYWRSSQGKSNYLALTSLVKYRLRTLQLQGAYTLSHAIDNQSDPLQGDFFDLNFTKIGTGTPSGVISSFNNQFDSNADRSNSDYDQRQNVFILGTWQSEGRRLWSQGWQVSGMAAFRTGFPYTIQAPVYEQPFGIGIFENQRGNLLNPSAAILSSPTNVPGGKILLNEKAFALPAVGAIGNTGRNAFRGPGLYNIDLSLARTFSIRILREGTRITLRADAFNVLNHANLNNPDSLLGSPTFGVATFGRAGTASGFPAVSPVNETARQFQILVRVEF